MRLFGQVGARSPRAGLSFAPVDNMAILGGDSIVGDSVASEGCVLAGGIGISAERVLEAYKTRGEGYYRELNAPCLTAVIDTLKHITILSRDRMGEKPAFYSRDRASLAFSDWPGALVKSGFAEPVVDTMAARELFGIGPARTPGETFLASVKSLPAGTALIFDGKSLKLDKYFSLEAAPHEDDARKTADTVRALIDEALVSSADRGCASMLSGGVDSSALTALLKKLNGSAASFSVEYERAGEYFKGSRLQPELDSPYVDLAVYAIKTDHTRVVLTERQLANALSDAMRARGMPGMGDVDSSLLLFARAIAGEYKSVLSGECGDEVFGGYPWFSADYPAGVSFPWSGKIELREAILKKPVREKLKLGDYARARYEEALERAPKLPGESGAAAKLRQMQSVCFEYFMPNLQERAYFMCGAAGLNVITPYSDARLAQYAFNVPWEMKFMKGREKGLLREAMRGVLPDELLYRKKSPYPKTWNPEYLDIVSREFAEIANNPASPILQLVDVEEIERLLGRVSSPADDAWFGQLMTLPQMIAYLIQIDAWLRAYAVKIEI